MSFSEQKFRALIKQHGYAGVAPFTKAAHISHHVIYRWFYTKEVGSLRIATKIANTLGISLDDFLIKVHGDDANKKIPPPCKPGRMCLRCTYKDCISIFLPPSREEQELARCGTVPGNSRRDNDNARHGALRMSYPLGI